MPTCSQRLAMLLCAAVALSVVPLELAAQSPPLQFNEPPGDPLEPAGGGAQPAPGDPSLPGPGQGAGPGNGAGPAGPVHLPPRLPVSSAAPEAPRQNAADPVVTVSSRFSNVEVVEKLSKTIQLGTRIRRVDGFDPEIIDVSALTQHRIRVQAIMQGVTTLVLTDENDQNFIVEIFVKGDTRHLQAMIENRFPDSSVEAYKVQDSVALTGWVSQPEHITQIVEIAEQFYPRVLNQMSVGGVQQVMLKVRIIEVQRSRLRRLGFDFVSVGPNGFLASTPSDLATLAATALAPGATSATVGSSSFSGTTAAVGVVSGTRTMQGFIEALKEEQLAKVLAEPTLITTNGHPAEMLAGGEFPILVPQSLGTVSIEWRDFGVRMEAVPMILGGGRVRLELKPEVTDRDFANSTTLSGTTVPALTTRRVNTQVEMRFGQTLMLAGLISSRRTGTTAKTPFLGELPWVGALFRRMRYDENETELVVMVTPELVSPVDPEQMPYGGPGTFTTDPTDSELYFDGYIEVPDHGNPCLACNGRGCPGCASMRRSPPSQTFTVPIEQQLTPLPETTAPPTADPSQAAVRQQYIRPDGGSGIRQVGYGTSGGDPRQQAVQAGYQQMSGRGSAPGAVQQVGGRPNATVRQSGLPGLIEP